MTNIDSILTGKLTDLELAIQDQNSLITIILSTFCFLFVLIGFSKILLFDMADEFGLRDEDTHKIKFNFRFFLFAALTISFCSSMYLLLDVFLENTYLQLLPVMILSWLLAYFEIEIEGLTNLTGRVFYITTRNLYFSFFFLVIILFSVIVFLIILTTLARKRVTSRFRKEEEEEEEAANRSLFKILMWLTIPLINTFLYFQLSTSLGTIVGIIFLILLAWWLFQLAKILFLILWRGFKITAFITSVNALLILPLIIILYVLPVITWTVWDIVFALQEGTIRAELGPIIQETIPILIFRGTDVLGIIQLDFVFITIIATIIVGFAEGFAIFAIFSAIFKGAEVARTGRIIARSPPKVVVISKYLILFGFWVGLFLNSFLNIWNMLILEFNINLPELAFPSIVYLLYNEGIVPLSEALEAVDIEPLKHIPFLLLPLYFILSGGFKFLSVTIITPRVKERLSILFLLISTSFVLIISTVLGDVYRIPVLASDAPLRGLESILSSAVLAFQYIEALAFYVGLIFGFFWVIRQLFFRKKPILGTLETTIDEVKEEEEQVLTKGTEEEITSEKIVEEEEILKEDLTHPPSPEIGITEKIANLGKLRDQGLISEEEFERKKAELLEKLV
ncbi:MAG: SHOCT domain-containing protein [Promethearchaeota archaeon]